MIYLSKDFDVAELMDREAFLHIEIVSGKEVCDQFGIDKVRKLKDEMVQIGRNCRKRIKVRKGDIVYVIKSILDDHLSFSVYQYYKIKVI